MEFWDSFPRIVIHLPVLLCIEVVGLPKNSSKHCAVGRYSLRSPNVLADCAGCVTLVLEKLGNRTPSGLKSGLGPGMPTLDRPRRDIRSARITMNAPCMTGSA